EYYENPIDRKDGSQRFIAWHNSVLHDDVGEIIGLFSSGEDITEQKQAEEALIEKETKYRTLFEDSIDGLALVDPETGIILDCNQALAKLVDRTKVELIGQPQRILHPVADPEARFSPTFNNHKSDAQGKRVETQIITKSSELKEVVILARIYELDGKKIIHSIFRDVTVKIKAEQTFRR
ncbi:MAG: PAS domain S-box protein, partial [SAR324 cluster bacterium]|nr:PAS domain S-box protein [SAR324 cluster bacterium]